MYININVTNLDNINQNPKPLSYNEVRSSPILYNPENFYMSIQRFTLDTQSLPVFIMPIVPDDNDNPNLSTLSIGFTYTGNTSNINYIINQQIIYSPQLTYVLTPPPPSQNQPKLQDNSTNYYSIFNYEYFISLINNAISIAYASLQSNLITFGDDSLTVNPPVLLWDNSTECATISYIPTFVGDIELLPIITMNSPLYSLFSSFNSKINAYSNLNNVNLIWSPYFDKSTVDTVARTIQQEYSTVLNWSPITSIVFTSNTIPIISELETNPLLLFNNNPFQNSGNNNNRMNIITDFASDVIMKPRIYYVPSSQYRYTQLATSRPFSNIEISVYYRIKTGELIPFLLTSGGNLTMKILFQKKNTLFITEK